MHDGNCGQWPKAMIHFSLLSIIAGIIGVKNCLLTVPDMDVYSYFNNLAIWRKKAFILTALSTETCTNNESGREIRSHDIDQSNWHIPKIWKMFVNTVCFVQVWSKKMEGKTKQWNENISNQFLFNRFLMKCVKKIMGTNKSRTKESLHAQLIT